MYEWQRDTLTRLTFGDDRTNYYPIWTPDGQRITYASADKGVTANMDLYWKRADGTGEAQRLTETKGRVLPSSWRLDGKVLALEENLPGHSRRSIKVMTMEGNETTGWQPGEPQDFLKSTFSQETATFSPDGRWLAYESLESGKEEVYVRPFSGTAGKWQVSTGGGYFPKWSRNGKELFYLAPDQRVMVASYTVSSGSFHADKPRQWSNVAINYRTGWSNFDVHPDGQRLAVLINPHASQEAPVNKVSFIFNFGEELRHKFSQEK